eukprot:CAMPEP_0194047474 /NCGR_PEP_ID=MMETSP0009_2-20130614/24936_1 /TAXON_ID=210454 /ORGANISM="Grammatophora oceanica, Strain CCMP 410" /LENGTH=315 /DNA_ID=CAMNT_0038693117 /DNA_START=96 /DNA_END=1043 /DNA_ORIENTATION=-
MSDMLAQAEEAIPAEVRMFSGCQDSQTSADVSNVATFQLPDPAGQAGGACTSAMLKVLYADHKDTGTDLSFQEVISEMRTILSQGKYTQIPQLSSSRPLNVGEQKFSLLPDDFSGRKLAVMIGINYVGHTQGQLSGCHNDVGNMKEYIKDVWGFDESNITELMDDGAHTSPTRNNILSAYKTLVSSARAGDAVFCHYSGHGGKLRDDDGDEADGYDETLVPLDYQTNGQIRDDDLFNMLVGAMPKGVYMTCVMDCCHSGSVLDLPYVFKGDGNMTEMTQAPDFDIGPLIGLAAALAAAAASGDDPMAQCGGCHIL